MVTYPGGTRLLIQVIPVSGSDAATNPSVDSLIPAGDTIPENIDVETKNIAGQQHFY